MPDEDEAADLIHRMNAELQGDTEFQEVRQLLSRLWDSYNEARGQSGQDIGAGVDSGTQERIRTLAATTLIGKGVDVSRFRTVASVEEAKRLLEGATPARSSPLPSSSPRIPRLPVRSMMHPPNSARLVQRTSIRPS